MNDQNEKNEHSGANDPDEDALTNEEAAGTAADEKIEAGRDAGRNADGQDSEGPDGSDDAGEAGELRDKLLRALADMENLRRRAQKDREDALKYGAANFARDMLSVADNLRRAIESLPEDGETGAEALKGFIEGVALTERDLLSALERHGISTIDPMGQKFDPQFHEALFEAPVPGAENGTVIQVVETGYVIHGRLLRPAKVGIAKAAPAAPPGPGDQVDTRA